MSIAKTYPKALAFFLAAVCTLVACDRDSVFEPSDDVAVVPDTEEGLFRTHGVTVMNRNLYVGAPVEMIYEPGANIPVAAAELWAWVQSTKFEEERADAIADEIKRSRPELIGLQEVSVFTVIRPCPPGPPFYCPPGEQPVPVQRLDFLDVLQKELSERGLSYTAASTSTNWSGAVPMLDGESSTRLSLIMLEDFDVVLVRDDVTWSNPQNGNFSRSLIVELAGFQLPILRGWASVDAIVDGFEFRFATFHLEPREPDPSINLDQGDELIGIVTNWPFDGGQLPTMVAGDVSEPEANGGPTSYKNLINAGFVDIWGPFRDGPTCCQAPDLLNPNSLLDRRVDVILMHGDFGRIPGFAIRTGHRQWNRTPSGLWPSDHAGVVARKPLPRQFAIR